MNNKEIDEIIKKSFAEEAKTFQIPHLQTNILERIQKREKSRLIVNSIIIGFFALTGVLVGLFLIAYFLDATTTTLTRYAPVLMFAVATFVVVQISDEFLISKRMKMR